MDSKAKFSLCVLLPIFALGCEGEEFEAQPEIIRMAEPVGYQTGQPVDAISTLENTFSAAFKRDGVLGGNLDLHGFILIETESEKLSQDVVLEPGIQSFKQFVENVVGQTQFKVRFVDDVAIITPPSHTSARLVGGEKPGGKEYHQMEVSFFKCRESASSEFSDELNSISRSLAEYYEVPPVLVDRNEKGILISAVFVYLPVRDLRNISMSF